MAQIALARLAVAGLAGDAGKTLVATGLARALRRRGLRVTTFKKGPDYIDSAWLAAAAGSSPRNLDTYLMPDSAIHASLARAARTSDVAVIEGNRGLFDGMDAEGSHSTAQLAKLIGAPVVLVVDVTKVTRTAAAQVLGCEVMDPKLNLAAVILNRVASRRHEAVIREAIAQTTDVPVLGAIPRAGKLDLPSRHLGLVAVCEHPRSEEMLERAAEMVERSRRRERPDQGRRRSAAAGGLAREPAAGLEGRARAHRRGARRGLLVLLPGEPRGARAGGSRARLRLSRRGRDASGPRRPLHRGRISRRSTRPGSPRTGRFATLFAGGSPAGSPSGPSAADSCTSPSSS